MKLLLTDSDRFPFDDEDRRAIADAGHELVELAGHDPDDLAAAAAGAAAVFVYYAKLPVEQVARLDGCRVLARCGTGYDNIDVAAARAREIEVVYVPDYGIDDVSDHTLALLLCVARKVALSDRAVRSGAWPSYADLGRMQRLRGSVLGLLGYGRIARAVATRARALGTRVIAHDPFVTDADVDLVERDDLFRQAHLVSVHTPLTAETRGSVGERELALMRSGSILVNTSRGPIVDGAALAAALRSGRLAGAGIDVFETQPLPEDHPLRACETAVLTPHSAAYTEEALAEVRKRPLADVLRILRGETPLDPVPA
ncbi:MAG: C-terminal binding protein [Actinobacteria bacterium]|nr:C-terminal binding protein [Actinomycetota bacterium]